MEAGEIIGVVSLAVGILSGIIRWGASQITKRFDELDKRNTEQHEANLNALKDVKSSVERVGKKIDDHITWHMGDSPHGRDAA
jgi:hypothetical protein